MSLEHIAEIIEAAAKSDRGIVALVLIFIAVLALTFFRESRDAVKLLVFLLMFSAAAVLGYAVYEQGIKTTAKKDPAAIIEETTSTEASSAGPKDREPSTQPIPRKDRQNRVDVHIKSISISENGDTRFHGKTDGYLSVFVGNHLLKPKNFGDLNKTYRIDDKQSLLPLDISLQGIPIDAGSGKIVIKLFDIDNDKEKKDADGNWTIGTDGKRNTSDELIGHFELDTDTMLERYATVKSLNSQPIQWKGETMTNNATIKIRATRSQTKP